MANNREGVTAGTNEDSLYLLENTTGTSSLTPVETTASDGTSSTSTINHELVPIRVESASGRDNQSDTSQENLAQNKLNMETTSFSNPAMNVEGPASYISPNNDSIINRETAQGRIDQEEIDQATFHQLARDGDIEIMQNKLKKFNVTQLRKKLARKDAEKLTPLHYAAKYNHLDMCKLLVEYGADIHVKGEDDMTPLHLVAKYKRRTKSVALSDQDDEQDDGSPTKAEIDNINILKFLLSEGASVNEKDFYGLTPLHQACLRGNTLVVRVLLERPGILVEAMDKQQMTPLHIAAVYGHNDIAELLMHMGANIRCKDEENGTPLHLASGEGHLEIVELLISKAQQDFGDKFVITMLKDKDNDGNTALHLAVDSGHLDITRYMVEKAKSLEKSLLNSKRRNRETPLHLAANNGHLQIVKLLAIHGARVNLADDTGSTPLILASKFNHFQIVKYLLDCGATINAKDNDDFTSLLIAANYGQLETIQLLIDHGADITAVDKQERNVLHQCAEEDRADVLQKILQDHKKIRELMNAPDKYGDTPLHTSASKGHFTILKVLLEQNAAMDLKNDDEQTPLHLAAKEGRVRVIKELIRKDKSVIRDDDEDANTGLHLAALEGRVQCVKELVEAGASIDARNVKQWTPLDCCASTGHVNCAAVLLESDSPVDPKDKRSTTPLHLACKEGHVDMVKLLLKWKADVSLRTSDGRNALDYAIDYGKEESAMAIMESTQWREALQNRTKDIATGEETQTPMRKLIKKMPEVAEVAFRNCVARGNKQIEHKNYKVTFDFEFLDDEYACAEWKEQSDVTSEASIAISSDASYEVYDDYGKINKNAEPYSHDSDILMKNHCLMIMVKSKRENLLRHPLVHSLLEYKWKSYGRVVYYINLLLYTLFMAVFNSYMLTVPPPYAINATATNIDGSCVKVVETSQGTWGTDCTLNHSFWRPIAQWTVIGLAALSLLKEIFQVLSRKHHYFFSVTNLLELSLYILCIITVIDVSDYSRNTGIREPWQWQCGALAVFLSWIGLLLFIQNFPRFGIYVLMFTDVLETFFSFFAVFLLFIFAFAFSFHALFQNQFAFVYWWNSIIKTIVMMIGEFEYDGLFNTQFTSTDYNDQVEYDGISYTIFFLFMVIMSIIIMNLLVGLAVDDIKEVQDHAKLERLAMQVKLVLDVEYTMPQPIRRRFLQKTYDFWPNHYQMKNRILRWFLEDSSFSAENINTALEPEKSELDDIEDKVDNIQGQIRKVRDKMRGVNQRTQNVESMLKAVIEHLKINWSDEQDDQD
ncbi:uncharacterized protein LOC120329316 isoform X2 [Styela clava]